MRQLKQIIAYFQNKSKKKLSKRPMGIRESLDFFREKYYQIILDKYGFKLYETLDYDLAVYYTYNNDHLFIRLSNDRDSIGLEVSSNVGEPNYYFLELIKDLVILHQNKNAQIDTVTLKKILTQGGLNPQQEVDFFDNNYSLIVTLFNKENYVESENKLKELGLKRAEFLFGSDFMQSNKQ